MPVSIQSEHKPTNPRPIELDLSVLTTRPLSYTVADNVIKPFDLKDSLGKMSKSRQTFNQCTLDSQ